MRLLLAGLIGMGWAAAQSAAVYQDPRVRIVHVNSELRASAPPDRHSTDYIWVDGSGIHFSRSGVNHVQRDGEIIIELSQRQTNPRNVCGTVLEREYLHCHEPSGDWLGANLEIRFETDQTRVGVLQIAPNATLAVPPADVPPVLIALEGTEAEALIRRNGASSDVSRRALHAADVFRSAADQVSVIRNTGDKTARFLVLEFGGAGE